jgi:hypothetical protein
MVGECAELRYGMELPECAEERVPGDIQLPESLCGGRIERSEGVLSLGGIGSFDVNEAIEGRVWLD